MVSDFARKPVSELLQERVKFLETHIRGLSGEMQAAELEMRFAVAALKDWQAMNVVQNLDRHPTIKDAVLGIMSEARESGWTQKQLREECLRRHDMVIRTASLPPQMQRLKKAGLVRVDAGLWWIC